MGASQPRQCIQAAEGEGQVVTVLDTDDHASADDRTSKNQSHSQRVMKVAESPRLPTKVKGRQTMEVMSLSVASSQQDDATKLAAVTSSAGSGPSSEQEQGGGGTGNKRSLSSVRKKMREERQANRPRITDRQLDTIRNTWNIVKRDQRDMGKEMFARMFTTYPNVKDAFSAFRYLTPEDQRFEGVLRAHGERVLMIVDQLLLQDTDCRNDVTLLLELGFKHVTFNAKSDYLDLVGQQFLVAIETVMKDNWTPEVEHAWAAFLHFIAYVMREAMIM